MIAKQSKYRAKPTTCTAGHNHASKREAARCAELRLLFRAGQITALAFEPTYHFEVGGHPLLMSNGHKAKYRPDFAYLEGNRMVVEDVKGFVVRDFPLRAALFRACYPDIELRVVK